MEFLEYNAEGSVAVQPAWTHCQHSVANICKLEHVGVSNREKLYRQMCQAVLHSKPKEQAFDFSSQCVPFEIVRMAGDGRCGWRALLASMDIAAFREVPRTGFQVCIYIYVYVCICIYTFGFQKCHQVCAKSRDSPQQKAFQDTHILGFGPPCILESALSGTRGTTP